MHLICKMTGLNLDFFFISIFVHLIRRLYLTCYYCCLFAVHYLMESEYLKQCCFPPNLSGHKCKHGYKHMEFGSAMTWDDALSASMRHYEHKSYNLFTCNCHSFAANCLNRLCYGGSMGWNMVNVGALILFKGHWVDGMSVLRSFLPFLVVACLGILATGWPFLIGLLSFSLLLMAWFVFGTYCAKSLLEC